MYEKYFSNFEYVDLEGQTCDIVLKTSPFEGVKLTIAQKYGIVENPVTNQPEIKFDYDITSIPSETFDRTLLEGEEFINLIRNIFLAMLEHQLIDNPNLISGLGNDPLISVEAEK